MADAWILTDSGDELLDALGQAQKVLDDAEYHVHRRLSRDELHNLVVDLKESLSQLCEALPSVDELERWGRNAERANSELQSYLVERQRFRLRLSPPGD